MTIAAILRGPLLRPRPDGTVDFLPDAALATDTHQRLCFVGPWSALAPQLGSASIPITRSDGLILPPFLDCHTHIPQHPIRGRFAEGIDGDPPEGRLLASLRRNVFPTEERAADLGYAARTVAEFAGDTLAQGVVGGAAFMTVHPAAARAALAGLPPLWSVGPVLMNQNCPLALRTDEDALERDMILLAADYGPRVIVADRFAVSVSTPLRRRAARLAATLGLRMQTHLNEQRAEKQLVEHTLYPDYASYTDVYRQDGLLARAPLLAHCIQMTPPEWEMVAAAGNAAIAHCPTSNTLLGSGTMPLDTVYACGLPYAICTDVGASPTTSLLAEMAQFLAVHAGRSRHATPSEALWHVTLGPAQILGVADQVGAFEIGMPLSYVVADTFTPLRPDMTADAVVAEALLALPSAPARLAALDMLAADGLPFGPALAAVTADVHATAARLTGRIRRVALDGKEVWQRAGDAPLLAG